MFSLQDGSLLMKMCVFWKAEKWLKEQAQTMGWAKATKLEGRTTLQGLIGLAVKENSAVAVEVNCETDFVARNKSFKSLVEVISNAYLKDVAQSTSSSLTKTLIDGKDLKQIHSTDGKSLGDHTALAISNLGENITIRRGMSIKTPSDMFLAVYAHPKPENPSGKVQFGKYGAVIVYQTSKNDNKVQQLVQQLCQHVIGMDPSKIGKLGEDEPLEDKDSETVMIHQEFLLDPSVTVGQLVEDAQIKIVDFIRLECGEAQKEEDKMQLSQC
ncbi:elongation factor Ts, mitochondrial isoform X2 [Cimex lectularius]|uniref:Elongation factor Ts, mitochondrial n=1 Tax=Cimex lectularius TaxID=79782 RepID=A0A8I6RPT9_CIMLE|nr:elongation factor Ts, mitochondrial isoform X2 [Cimex lectularius]